MILVGIEMNAERTFSPTTVAIVYGDPVVGQALALLLQGTDFDVKFEDQSSLHGPVEILELLQEIQVLILAPGMNVERREDILTRLRSTRATTNVYVIELGVPPEGTRSRPDRYVPWPIRMEDLKRYIEVGLAEARRAADPRRQVSEEKEEGS